MIDIFKSDREDKVIIAIYPDAGFAVSNSGDVGLLIGPQNALDELRITLNSLHDGWTKDEVNKTAFKQRPVRITTDLREEIYKQYDEGNRSDVIASNLLLSNQQVRSVIGARTKKMAAKVPDAPKIKGLHANQTFVLPTSENLPIEPTTTQGRIDNIIIDGVNGKADYVSIAARIGNEVGGAWLPDDVAKRIKELRA